MSFDSATGAGSFDCLFLDNTAGSGVSVTVADDDGGAGTGTVTVLVANVAPTVTLVGPPAANEGEAADYEFTASDPGADTFVLDDLDCGAEGTLTSLTFDAATGAGTFNCTYADDSPLSTISLTLSDDDGGSGSASNSFAVSNVPPVVELTGPAAVDEGDTATYVISVFEPGAEIGRAHV